MGERVHIESTRRGFARQFWLAACRVAGLSLAAALFTAAPATAQIPTSTHDIIPGSAPPTRSDTARADLAFRDMMACVLQREPARARNLVESLPGSHEEARLSASLQSRMESCFDYAAAGRNALIYDLGIARGVVAELLLARDFPNGLAPADPLMARALETWTRPRVVRGAPWRGDMVHAMARCVAARRPADVLALVRSTPFTPAETALMRALRPDLTACLEQGVALEASPQALRALLAEAAWQHATNRVRGFVWPELRPD
jgi:hypothetical protein